MSSLFFYNAHLLSFHDGFPSHHNCLAIDGNTIVATGTYDELQPLIQPNTIVIDASGKTIMPGLNDTHIHLWKVGNLKTYMLDVRGATSKEHMLDMLRDYHQKYPDVAWVTARGFNEAAWKDSSLPTKDDLDKITTHKPIYVIRTCAHIAVTNSAALRIAGIDAYTQPPAGGVIEKDADGKPNGIFSETALGLITRHIPAYKKEELKTMLLAARTELYSYGITAATDPAVDPLLMEAYHELNNDNALGFRLNALPIIIPDGGSTPYPVPLLFQSDFLQVNTVKFFSDGGLSGQTAALKRHYKNSNAQGVLRLIEAQYLSLCTAAMEKGLGIATHAIGDAAIEFIIRCYEQLHAIFPCNIKRIEHLGLPEKQHLERMAASNIAASMQTIFLSELGKNFKKYLDDDYLSRCYPVRSVMQHGILTALSSDAPVVKDFNPLKGCYAAVTRETNEGEQIAPAEAIDITTALKAYTVNAAAISGLNNIGHLAKGMKADIIMLDKNPLTTATNQLTSIQVQQTFVDGKLVWQQ